MKGDVTEYLYRDYFKLSMQRRSLHWPIDEARSKQGRRKWGTDRQRGCCKSPGKKINRPSNWTINVREKYGRPTVIVDTICEVK